MKVVYLARLREAFGRAEERLSLSGPEGHTVADVIGVLRARAQQGAQTIATLSSTRGDNVFHAGGRGIADDRETGCTLFGGTAGAAACNGPRETASSRPKWAPLARTQAPSSYETLHDAPGQ